MPAASVQLYCLPDQNPIVTTVTFRDGWSPSLNGLCYEATAFNSTEEEQSITIVQREPDDCIPVSEPETKLALSVALVVVAAIAWVRKKGEA